MCNEKIFDNYKLSLEQKYNAVCFDIDGTLTGKKSGKIDSRAIEMIANLLKRKVPVVFITGRGETGINDLKNDIFFDLKNKFYINDNEFRRLYVLANDGARLFYTNKYDENILKNNFYISTYDELNSLKIFNDNIIKHLNLKSLNNICDITYSKDLKNDTILNIRIVFKVNDNSLINEIFDVIQEVVTKYELNNIYISRGIYKDKNVIQIGTAQKDQAIKKVEQIIGVPEDSMIRIGDCGDIRGNDYSMLNCGQGYSVDKTCESINSCFPVFDDNGNILKGIDATLFLIKKAKILPTVCLEKANEIEYKYNYACVEKNIILGRNGHLKYFNEILNNKFKLINGINDLFDKSSGSIKIPMYEWELMPNNSLKKFWSTNENEKLLYSIRDDNNYLLRGSRTYYYFLANRKSDNRNDLTTKEVVLEWYCNYLEFLKKADNAISDTNEINSVMNKKLILGIFDNIRNILLVILYHKLYSKYFNQNVILNLNSDQDLDFKNLYNMLTNTEKIMANLCFSTENNISKNQMLNIIKNVYNEVENEYNIIKKSNVKYYKKRI